jgi:hypothetical protein
MGTAKTALLLLCLLCSSFFFYILGQPPSFDKQSLIGLSPSGSFYGIAGLAGLHHYCLVELYRDALNPEADQSPKLMRSLLAEFEIRPEQRLLAARQLNDRLEAARELNERPERTTPLEPMDFRKEIELTEHATLALMAGCLNERQFKRFQELACQLSGPIALRLDNYADRFNLSTEQRAVIGRLVDDYSAKVEPLLRAYGANLDFAAKTKLNIETTTKANALALELDEKILDMLSSPQRKAWKAQTGRAFDWSVIAPPKYLAMETRE